MIDSAQKATEAKDSQAVTEALSTEYERIRPKERPIVENLLFEWAISGDEILRYDAVALIDAHRVVAAIPTLRALATRLKSSPDPKARFERLKVERVIEGLTSPSTN